LGERPQSERLKRTIPRCRVKGRGEKERRGGDNGQGSLSKPGRLTKAIRSSIQRYARCSESGRWPGGGGTRLEGRIKGKEKGDFEAGEA